jgi:hypothetical protein
MVSWKMEIIGLPAMSAPPWRDRHLACYNIEKLLARLQCLCPRGATAIWLAATFKKKKY